MRTSADDFSRMVFGSEKRLMILATISRASQDDCYPTKIAELSGAPTNAVSQLMARLVSAGVLEVVQARRGDNLKRHRKLASALWEWSDRLFAEFDS